MEFRLAVMDDLEQMKDMYRQIVKKFQRLFYVIHMQVIKKLHGMTGQTNPFT